MIEVEGKQVFSELAELVDPAHAALIVVDMQRDFCIPGGAFDRIGIDISMYPPMVPRLARLIEGPRAAVVPSDCVASDDRAQHDASMLLMRHRFDIATSDEIVGTWAENDR